MFNPTGRILVIDTDPITLTANAAVMHHFGHETHCARTPHAAIAAVDQHAFDLLLIDAGKSTDEAAQLLQSLRQQPGANDVPAIVLVGHGQTFAATTQPATYVLTKPFDPNTLAELTSQALWLPHLVGQYRKRGSRPDNQSAPSSWLRL
jgi:CheY-like chemotaxis protein